MSEDEPGGGTESTEPAPPQFARGSRVLVAEDNPTNQIIVVAMLQKLGLQHDMVANGLEALAAVANTRYDLVLMDMQMPEMDGLEATRYIRQLPDPLGRIPIIGVTANAFREDHLRCLEAGMQAVVTKPFLWTDLARVMAPHMALEGDVPIGERRIAAPSAWHKLIRDVGRDAACAITRVFLNDSRSRLVRMAAHRITGDVQAIGREAHALKSSVDLLGFELMTSTAARLELAGKEAADIGEVGGLVDELTTAFVAVEAVCAERLAD